MHRTLPSPWALLGGLIALLAAVLAPAARAQLCTPEPRPLVVLLNGTARLQLASKKPIRTVTNPKEGILTIRTVERDPTTIVLIGTAPGITCLELEDADGGREHREVLVQADVEYLNRQLRCAVPLSQIKVIPNGTNTVILNGFVHRAEDIQVAQAVAQSVGWSVINGLRLNGVQQVQLDVVIALVRRSKGRDFGFNFLQNSRHQISGSTVGNLIPPLGAIGAGSGQLGPTNFGQTLSAPPGQSNLFLGIIGNHAGFLAFLQALETEGLAKLMAQPRLVTLSGNPASFLVGGEQAVPVPAGLGQVGVQFEEFGTRLNFLPIVLGNGRIHLEVEPEVSVLDPTAGVAIAGATVAGRATQRVHTTVELETAQTFVIGGLIQKTATGSANKVPVIGQLPFVGALFSTKSYTEDESELVVMVTPHLVDAQTACQIPKVLPGEESRRPDDFELFLEGILEAPRGPRAVFQGNHYVPAWQNDPTAKLFPCAGSADGLYPKSLLNGTSAAGGGCSAAGGCNDAACPTSALPAAPGLNGSVQPTKLPPADPVAPTSLTTNPPVLEPPVAAPEKAGADKANPDNASPEKVSQAGSAAPEGPVIVTAPEPKPAPEILLPDMPSGLPSGPTEKSAVVPASGTSSSSDSPGGSGSNKL
jgi:pilus assembly protein CpaC